MIEVGASHPPRLRALDRQVDTVTSSVTLSPTMDVRDQLLTAAFEAATLHGIARLSMAEVAQRAGLSRQTLYRHFPSKDILIAEVVERETATLISRVTAAAAEHGDPRASFEAGVLASLIAVREHPLLDRLLTTEPDTLLPLLTTDGGPVLRMAREIVLVIVDQHRIVHDPTELRRFADVVSRLLVSYAIAPPDDPPEVVAQFLTQFLIPQGALT